MNVAGLLKASAESHPHQVALRFGPRAPERAVDFAAFEAAADRVARAVVTAGISPGDRVAIGMHNIPQFAYAYFGILRTGAVAVPLNALGAPQEVRAVLEDSGARALFSAPPFEEIAAAAARDTGVDVYGVSPDKQIRVQNPSNCKTDCPACSRVCPEVAILFPKYKMGPINGDEVRAEDIHREKMKVDISALLGGDIYAALRQRSRDSKERFARERDEKRALPALAPEDNVIATYREKFPEVVVG